MAYRRRRVYRARRRFGPRRAARGVNRVGSARTVARRSARPIRAYTRPTPGGATNVYRLADGRPSFLPQVLYTTLRWVQRSSTAHAGGAPNLGLLTPNNLFQIFSPTPAHQPRYFDQICNDGMYKEYLVMSVRYVFLIPEISNVGQWVMTVAGNTVPGISTSTAFLDMAELPFSQLTYSQIGQVTRLSGSFNCWDVFGVTKAQYVADPAYRGTFATQPIKQLYQGIYSGPIDQASGGPAVLNYWSCTYELDTMFCTRDWPDPS